MRPDAAARQSSADRHPNTRSRPALSTPLYRHVRGSTLIVVLYLNVFCELVIRNSTKLLPVSLVFCFVNSVSGIWVVSVIILQCVTDRYHNVFRLLGNCGKCYVCHCYSLGRVAFDFIKIPFCVGMIYKQPV